MKNATLLVVLVLLSMFACKTPSIEKNIEINELSIADIHQQYKQGTYTSEQLVHAYLKNIDSLNTTINALTIINPKAIEVAKQLDAEFAKTGVLRPLHGIPIIVKDNINTVGLPTTAGSFALQDFIPSENAFIIQKLVDAGAIIIAKSNMAEWAFSAKHTNSSTGGTTLNPYNLAYVPAGSSGGTAAAIASNLAVGGLGTDTGNSIRGPSSHCALVGFRTTLGLISREGIVPLYLRNDVVGPMCRNVEDATRMMEVMVGVDKKDPLTKNSEGKGETAYQKYLEKDGLKGAKIGVLKQLSEHNIDPEIETLFETSLADLEALGAEVIPVEIPNFDELRKSQWCATFKADVEAFLATYVKNDSLKTLEDIIAVGTTSDYSRANLVEHLTELDRYGDDTTECLDVYHDVKRIAFREAIENTMDSLQIDALVYPTWNNKPAKIERFAEDYLGDNNQVIAPHTGQPAFTVPMGYTTGNLPVGLQFLGKMYQEPTLIKLSYAYEQGTKHRKMPDITIDKK